VTGVFLLFFAVNAMLTLSQYSIYFPSASSPLRYRLGEMPAIRLKVFPKWGISVNPDANATSLTDMLLERKSSIAMFIL
jgi:hypothetical protein